MTVSPALIVTVLSCVTGFSNPKSTTVMFPGAASAPDPGEPAAEAIAGIPIPPTATHASHGKYLFLRPNAADPLGNVCPRAITHGRRRPFDALIYLNEI